MKDMFQELTPKRTESHDKDFLFLRSSNRYEKIDKTQILFIRGMREYLMVFLDNRKVITYMNFEKIIDLLGDDNFIRIHKSFVINLNKISYLDFHYVKILDHHIPIGRVYKKSFFSCLKELKVIL